MQTRRAIAAILVAMLFISMAFVQVVSAKTGAPKRQLPPNLDDFVDSVTLKVREMKEKGMNDTEIVEALKPLGMGYWPKTGATWIGRSPTPEELKKLPPRKYPFDDVSSVTPTTTAQLNQANQVMETVYYSYRGFCNYMKPGSLAVKAGESVQHLATTHTGWGDTGQRQVLSD